MTEPHIKYMQSQILTATPEKLVLLLYDASIRLISQAKIDIAENKLDKANENLCKAQAIVAELMSSLDLECGEIALNLFDIYHFLNEKLIEANLKKDTEPLDEISPLFNDLRDAWKECFKKNPTERALTDRFSAIK